MKKHLDIQIQKASLPDDFEVIRPLLEMLNGKQSIDESLDEFRRCRDDVYTASVRGQLAGFVSLSFPYWNRVGIIDHIAVTPEFRRQDVGTQLIEFVESLSRAKRLRILTVQTASWNNDAIAFYEAQGFQMRCCLPEYMGPGNDLIWLDKVCA